jgi:H+/gluconate symporter-like permease
MPTYTELFMVKAVTYVKNFFPIFMLGAIFGKVMEETGMAKSIAKAIIGSLGPKNAVLSTVLSAAVLTYGGVSMFVVVFAVYPFAAALFRADPRLFHLGHHDDPGNALADAPGQPGQARRGRVWSAYAQ